MQRAGKPVILKVGSQVLLKESAEEVINWEDKVELKKRLFRIKGLSHSLIQGKYDFGVIILMHNSEARNTTSLKMSDGAFTLDDGKTYRKLSHIQFNALVENIDFSLSKAGEIKPLVHAEKNLIL